MACADSIASYFQWGWDDTDGAEHPAFGEISFSYVVGDDLDTCNRFYWVKTFDDATECVTKSYYNPPPSNCLNSVYDITLDKVEIGIFPNPNHGVFNLQISGKENGYFEFEIWTAHGKMIERHSIIKSGVEQAYEFDVLTNDAGFYIGVLKKDSKVIGSRKFIVVKTY